MKGIFFFKEEFTEIACSFGQYNVVNFFQNDLGRTGFMIACYQGRNEVVKISLDHFLNANPKL